MSLRLGAVPHVSPGVLMNATTTLLDGIHGCVEVIE
jgi:hypothetical protein